MTDKQPEALRLADWVESVVGGPHAKQCAAELRHQHAELETLRAGYAAARLEIEPLKAQSPAAHGEHAELRRLSDCCPELNLSNYGPDDVDELNGWAIEVSQCIDRALAAQPAGAQQPAIMPKGESAAAQLRAMATNYPTGHLWDKLDAKVCIHGALEIEALRASHGQAPAQAAPVAVVGPSEAVAYLDIGAGGYLDLGTDLTDEALSRLPKGRHALVIAGTYGIDGYIAAPTIQPAPQQEPSCTSVQLAEMVLSDCGHSSNYTPLLERVAARIDAHVERCLESKKTPQQEAQEPVARLEIGKTKGGVSLTHIAEPAAFQLPEGMYALYTTPQPTQAQAEPKSGAKSFQTYGEANAYSKGYYAGKKAATQAQAQAGAVPLTDEQIEAAAPEYSVDDFLDFNAGVRFAERHHGIKGGQHGL